MPLAPLEEEVKRFLSVDTPEVICIRGSWGVGKTFAWNRYLTAARDAGAIKLDRYSYVSLFGINSLDELRYAIFENTVRSAEIGTDPSLESLDKNASAAAERFGRKSLWFLQQLPFVKNHIGGLGPVWYLSINKYLICLDDIERKGRNLPIRDVFGLISQLKEQKRCKIVLILNDNALDEEREDFNAYFDKTIDASLAFDPTSEEATAIALTDQTPGRKLIAQHCIQLGISNIRIIRRIERLVAAVHPLLSAYDEQVFRQAIHSLTLLGWGKYDPAAAPPWQFIKERHNVALKRAVQKMDKKEEEIPVDEAKWTAILDAYNFQVADEFDHALADGVESGFFDSDKIQQSVGNLDRQIRAGKSQEASAEGWRLFHESFQNNEDEIRDQMFNGTLENIEYVTPLNFNSVVTFLKSLNHSEQASELIRADPESC